MCCLKLKIILVGLAFALTGKATIGDLNNGLGGAVCTGPSNDTLSVTVKVQPAGFLKGGKENPLFVASIIVGTYNIWSRAVSYQGDGKDTVFIGQGFELRVSSEPSEIDSALLRASLRAEVTDSAHNPLNLGCALYPEKTANSGPHGG